MATIMDDLVTQVGMLVRMVPSLNTRSEHMKEGVVNEDREKYDIEMHQGK